METIKSESHSLEYICEGCERADESVDFKCLVYARPPSYYVRQGCCPFNMPKRIPKKLGRVRVGQKKTKRVRG